MFISEQLVFKQNLIGSIILIANNFVQLSKTKFTSRFASTSINK